MQQRRIVLYRGVAYSIRGFALYLRAIKVPKAPRYETFIQWVRNPDLLKYKLTKLGFKVNVKQNTFEIKDL